MDYLSKSDPQVILYTRHPSSTWQPPPGRSQPNSGYPQQQATQLQSAWVEVGRTELIKDNHNPVFAKSFVMDYFFEREQPLSSKGQTLRLQLQNPRYPKVGSIKIVAEEVVDMKMTARFQFRARNLDKKDWFGLSDPFYTISRSQEDGSWTVVHRSEPIMKTLDPFWPVVKITLSTLCGGDRDRQLLIQVHDWKKSGSTYIISALCLEMFLIPQGFSLLNASSFHFTLDHALIGQFKASFNELTRTQGLEVELIDPVKKEKGKKYTNSGVFKVVEFAMEKEDTFLDYIAGGTTVSLAVAIDFTQSNGEPFLPNSLHYRDPYVPNQYQQAITAVGRILEVYDTDKVFPVYGFGAKLPSGFVSHKFACNGFEDNPNVFGVDGILEAYNHALSMVRLYGPTNFAPIIRLLSDRIRGQMQQEGPGGTYHILLILTDGEVTDMESTISSIVDASMLPLSIVIVGVGNADFGKMEHLDSDGSLLKTVDGRRSAVRDIVQFVPIRNYGSDESMLARA
ncbi:Copine-8, partial [Quaeritorhiza haematococci]